MNVRILSFLGLALAAPLAAQAGSDASAFLVKADVMKVQADKSVIAIGRAALITKTGMRFTAEQLTYDQESGTVKLSGDVTIHAADGNIVRAKELTIDLKGSRVFMLSPGKVTMEAGALSVIPETASGEFMREFPKTELNMRRAEIRP